MFNSDIVINNLGPISKANINLKNLTVFVGQNNTGKTYLLSCLFFFQTTDFKKYYLKLLRIILIDTLLIIIMIFRVRFTKNIRKYF